MSLLKHLTSSYSVDKSFTKKFHDEVKRNIDDYEACQSVNGTKKTGVYNRHVAASRYDITIPYIFATHESMLSSFFETMPDIVISGRTSQTKDVAQIKAIYQYLVDVADLDEFLSMSAWWFFLVGMCKADVSFKTEIKGYIPQLDAQQMPMMDEQGEPVEIPVYKYNDPVALVDNPLKVYFSPESEFSIDGKKIPHYFTERLVDIDEIKDVYGVDVDADEQIEVDEVSKEDGESLKRAKVLYFYGTLPSTVQDEEDFKKQKLTWKFGQNYKIFLTKDTILLAEAIDEKPCKFARFYTSMNKFFGFGIGKTLRPFQEDMSIRRGQELAYADRFAFPWLTLPNGVKVDQKNLMDYEKKTPLAYSSDQSGLKPEYLTPPPMPASITDADTASRNDAQFVSGTLDLSKGAQQSTTVKTATGQQLFAQSQDKRLQKARKSIAKYYREVVIQMFKEARDNWGDDHKKITYQDEEGNDQDIEITAQDLQDIDFDTDIDFNLDSVSVNADIMSQRWISLLDTSINVPVANLKKIYGKVLSESFKIPNPESYIQEPPMQPGMPDQGGQITPEAASTTNPETVPQPETMGAQLAPQPQFAG